MHYIFTSLYNITRHKTALQNKSPTTSRAQSYKNPPPFKAQSMTQPPADEEKKSGPAPHSHDIQIALNACARGYIGTHTFKLRRVPPATRGRALHRAPVGVRMNGTSAPRASKPKC